MATAVQDRHSQVLTEIQAGDALSISKACEVFPGHSGQPRLAFTTFYRWITKGVSTPAGVVKVEAVRCGARWLTSQAAVNRFIVALTEAQTSNTGGTAPRSPTARNRASDEAERELERMGA